MKKLYGNDKLNNIYQKYQINIQDIKQDGSKKTNDFKYMCEFKKVSE